MAKIKLAGAVGEISGSVGGNTYSRNRYGPYIRLRSVPTLVQNEYTLGVREAFSNASRLWYGLTIAQRAAWNLWSSLNPVVDRLGEKVQLAGNAAFIRINALLLQAGLSTRDDPPVGENPQTLSSLTFTADIGAGNFGVVFTPSPLPADTHLVIEGALRGALSQTYLRNAWRTLMITTAAATSPIDLQDEFVARFGDVVVGQVAHVRVRVMIGSLGLLSAPMTGFDLVVDTV